MADYLKAFPHGGIDEVFPDVFLVTGGFGFGPGLSITRNMMVVRQAGELTLINSVRLTPEGEEALEKLGKVAHVVRIGFFHGADDPYYVQRYRPTLWAPEGISHAPGTRADRVLGPGQSPVEGSTVFLFERGTSPEAVMLLERDGGILVSCDSYQNWTTFDGCSFLGKIMMRAMGFGPTLIGGPWVKRMGPGVKADFDRLLDLPFRHVLPGHGTLLRDRAKEGLRTAMAHRFAG